MLTLDRIKLALASAVAIAGIAVFYMLGEKPAVVRVAAVLAGFAVGAAIAVTTELGRAGLEFAKEARVELRKVVWPTRKETVQVTLTVIVMVIVVALFLWLVDWLLGIGVQALTQPKA
jgi:preprotein translocase subunit SecE